MSWIIGAIPKNKIDSDIILSAFDEKIVYKYESDKIKLYAGSLSDNLHFFKNYNDAKNGWLVSGIGLQSSADNTKILQHIDWTDILVNNNKSEIIKNLDGHFIIIQWDDNFITFYSDLLGLRDIYIAENENGVFFSTNVIWLSRLFNLEIDFSEFGSRWLLFNQISDKSIFKGIHRIVAGKRARISLNQNLSVEYKDNNWLPSNIEKQFEIEEFSSKLSSLINLKLPKENRLSLSFSGGMDSRVILSYLLKNENISYDTHTFGNSEHPDSKIASEIAANLGLQHEQFNIGLPSIEKCIKNISEYTSQTLVNNAASAFLQLQNYSFLKGRRVVLIDGGFGEIWRREFFYKLFLRGKDALLEKNAKKIIPFLMLQRADVFSSDTMEEMMKGIEIQVNELFAKLPEIEKKFLGNWLDIFAIKTRLTNYYSHEQSRLDNYLTSVMPFIQLSILQDLFNMPINLRQNGKLFRKIIKINAPILEKFSLAKGQSTHPYFLNSLQSRLWIIARKKLKLNVYQENNTRILLQNLKEFVYDTVNSKEVKETSYYVHAKIKNIVELYYNGDTTYSNALDWWLSFELFRQKFSK